MQKLLAVLVSLLIGLSATSQFRFPDKDMDTQRSLLSEEFDRWKAGIEQLDDVCVMGLRV